MALCSGSLVLANQRSKPILLSFGIEGRDGFQSHGDTCDVVDTEDEDAPRWFANRAMSLQTSCLSDHGLVDED